MPRRNARRGKSPRKGRAAGKSSGKQRSAQAKGGPGGAVTRTSIPGGFGDSARIKLCYAGRYGITSSVAVTYQRFVSSAYDPDNTGTGGQPAMFDDWALRYNQFWVTNMHVTVESIATAAAPVLAMAFSRDAMPSFNVDDIQAAPYSMVVFPRTTGGTNQVWRMSMAIPKLFGLTEVEYLGDPTYACTGTANPTQFGYFVMAQESYDGSTSSVGWYTVKIEYEINCGTRISGELDLEKKISHMRALAAAKPKPKQAEGITRPSPSKKDETVTPQDKKRVVEETKQIDTAETKSSFWQRFAKEEAALDQTEWETLADDADIAGFLLWKKQQAKDKLAKDASRTFKTAGAGSLSLTGGA